MTFRARFMLIALLLALLALVSALRIGTSLQSRDLARLIETQLASAAATDTAPIRLAELEGLPAPVSRYLRNALGDGQRPIRVARLTQTGELRTDPASSRWVPFRAEQVITPPSRGFIWDAKVAILPLIHVRVRDAYFRGRGSGQVSLLSAVTVAADRGRPELNAAALHRYLAEAVWYPAALLPSAGVQWSPVDGRRALATLTDSGFTVSLEFRFNGADEVAGIHATGRWRRSAEGYELVPWEGHFSDYRRYQGMLVPTKGEVGWYSAGRLQIVWRGNIESLEYQFEEVSG